MGRFKKAAITCDHGICSEIGRDIMLYGGNAIDSTIASLFCLGVTNPQSSGLGIYIWHFELHFFGNLQNV